MVALALTAVHEPDIPAWISIRLFLFSESSSLTLRKLARPPISASSAVLEYRSFPVLPFLHQGLSLCSLELNQSHLQTVAPVALTTR